MTGREPLSVGSWRVEPDVGRIVRDSSEIALRRQVMDLLVYLADNAGQVVSTDDLLKTLWAGKYVTEGTLYNCVRELREALGDDQTYVETIPRRGYQLVAPVDLESTEDAATRPSRIAIWVSAAVAAVVVIGVSILWQVQNGDGTDDPAQFAPPPNSIAVLPFADLSPDRANDYLGHGLSESLIHQLAQVPDLHVVSRTSSFSFQGTDMDVPRIGEALNVEAVLEGSVQKEGDTLRVFAQLINVRSGSHVWSGKYDRSVDSLFELQDEISLAVAVQVSGAPLGPADLAYAAAASPDPAAYELYLRGQYQLNTLFAPGQTNVNMDAPAQALDFFRRATETDPNFALAWAARARATFMQVMMERMPPSEAMPRIEDFMARAMASGSELAEVQFVAGELRRGEDALPFLDRAIEINPNYSAAHVVRAGVLLQLHRYRESFESQELAARLDPLNGMAVEGALYARFYRGDWNDLATRLEASNRLWPDANGLTTEAHLVFELGRFDQLPELERQARVIPGYGVSDWYASAPRHFGDSYLALGLIDEARDWLTAPGMVASYDDVLLLHASDFDGAAAFLIEQLETGRDRPPFAYRWYPDIVASLAETYLYARRYEELVMFLEGLGWGSGLPPLPNCCLTNPPWSEVAYAHALAETGRGERAAEWLESLATQLGDRLDQGVHVPNHYYELARVRALQGRTDDAFTALETAINLGWRRWYLDKDPVLDTIRAHPGYAELRARYQADIDAQRDAVVGAPAK